MAHLRAFHGAPHCVDYGNPGAGPAAAKSYPVRDMNLTGNDLCGDLQIRHAEETCGVEVLANFGNHQCLRLRLVEEGLGAVSGFQIDNVKGPGQLLELIRIERSIDGIEAIDALFRSAAVPNLEREKKEGYIEDGDGTKRSVDDVPQRGPKTFGGKLFGRFFARNIGPQPSDAGHSKLAVVDP